MCLIRSKTFATRGFYAYLASKPDQPYRYDPVFESLIAEGDIYHALERQKKKPER